MQRTGLSDLKTPLIQIKNLHKSYQLGKTKLHVLKGINLRIKEGEMVALMGPSGSGKTTLLNLIGVLDTPDSGEYVLDNEFVSKDSNLPHIRSQKIGFIFQTFNLLPRISALKNVEVPMIYSGIKHKDRHKRANTLLQRVGLKERVNNKPNELSGGESQRVAIARSLANKPKIILADEPTGNLDSKTGKSIMKLLKSLNQKDNVTILIVTHENAVAKECGRIINILDGRIVK